ncbi:MAG: hypothetical protein DLM72_18920, partial [Candidatus Nitrosopolaris wilkensis]
MTSVVVATILVAGALVLPYNYAMAHKSIDMNSIKVQIEKKIHQEVSSHAKGGNANGGHGGHA